MDDSGSESGSYYPEDVTLDVGKNIKENCAPSTFYSKSQ